MKSLWPASANPAGKRKALSRPVRSGRAMDTQDILDVALRLAQQSEIPSDTTINVPAKDVRRALFGIDVEAIDTLYAIPEFHAAKTRIAVRMGKIDNPLGKWAVHHGAGTNGGLPVARAAFEHSIDTVLYIHIDAGALRRLWELFGREGSKNLVVTGHVASDSIGINELVRELRTRGLRVDTYSGIVDV